MNKKNIIKHRITKLHHIIPVKPNNVARKVPIAIVYIKGKQIKNTPIINTSHKSVIRLSP